MHVSVSTDSLPVEVGVKSKSDFFYGLGGVKSELDIVSAFSYPRVFLITDRTCVTVQQLLCIFSV